MNTMVNVGPSVEAIHEARASIIRIIETVNADATKQCALDALKTICSVNNTTIRDCVFKSEAPVAVQDEGTIYDPCQSADTEDNANDVI